MGAILMILAVVLWLVSLVCGIIILIDAFKNEIWKGIVYILCPLYALYYTFVEFENERKWLIIAGAFLGSIGAEALMMAGAGAK